jgi:hypothetical protein
VDVHRGVDQGFGADAGGSHANGELVAVLTEFLPIGDVEV